MVKVQKIMVLVCIFMAPYAFAVEGSDRDAVEQLLKTMRSEENMAAVADEMVNQQLQMQPCLEPLRAVFKNFMKDALNWGVMKEDMITLYASEFSPSEINEMNTFYKTPVGQKVVDKLPKLAGKGAEISMKAVEKEQPKLQAAIMDAISNIDLNTIPEQCRSMYAKEEKPDAK